MQPNNARSNLIFYCNISGVLRNGMRIRNVTKRIPTRPNDSSDEQSEL